MKNEDRDSENMVKEWSQKHTWNCTQSLHSPTLTLLENVSSEERSFGLSRKAVGEFDSQAEETLNRFMGLRRVYTGEEFRTKQYV